MGRTAHVTRPAGRHVPRPAAGRERVGTLSVRTGEEGGEERGDLGVVVLGVVRATRGPEERLLRLRWVHAQRVVPQEPAASAGRSHRTGW